jgi:hypothetical protein
VSSKRLVMPQFVAAGGFHMTRDAFRWLIESALEQAVGVKRAAEPSIADDAQRDD